MQSSQEEARLVLEKWRAEQTPVVLLAHWEETAVVRIRGRIAVLEQDALALQSGREAHFLINFAEARFFFGDADIVPTHFRELTGDDYESAVSIVQPSGQTFTLVSLRQ